MESAIVRRVLVVGAGLTGAATAAILRTRLQRHWQITVWEKSKETGGRMCTSYDSETNSSVDLGAQYITASAESFNHHGSFYADLVSSGVLKCLTGRIEGQREDAAGTQHFIPWRGMSSVVEHFMKKAGVDVQHECPVESLDIWDDRWLTNRSSGGDGHSESFDCVVLTAPIPDVMRIQGDIRDVIDNLADVKARLARITYSCRHALGLFYKPGVSVEQPWHAKYVSNDPCVRFMGIRQGGDVTGSSVVVHTSVPFSMQHAAEDVGSVCTDRVLPAIQSLMPQLPPPDKLLSHFWNPSQASQAYEGQEGAVLLHTRPLLVIGGDAFTQSTFDGCIDSALQIADIVQQNVA